jgi:phosphatidylserine decarboxylase
MRIHKEGYVILTTLLIILIIANFLFFSLITGGSTLARVFLIFSVILFLTTLWFFRVPERTFLQDANHIVSPADGTIVTVEETEENEYFHDRRLQVSIFMSPLNVHVNLFPIEGVVRYYKYHPGKYLVAWHPKSSASNERTSVVIENSLHNAIMVRQIAGVLARRIVCYAKEGEKVLQGQELGFIKFGSRIDLFLPADAKLKVRIGDKVSGKTSVIASFR